MLTIDLGRAQIAPGQLVLDIGCGGGRHAYACAKAGAHVIAVDLDLEEVRAVSQMITAMRDTGEVCDETRAAVARASALNLPFADGLFDAVIAAEVLEHLDADDVAIAELSRVLRPGGVLSVSVPRTWPEAVNWMLSRDYHEVPGGHVRIYRRRELRRKLAGERFRLLSSDHRHGLHSPYWWLRCLVGVTNEEHRLVRLYHRFLVWDIVRRPRLTRVIERALDPLVGKSLVLYLERSP